MLRLSCPAHLAGQLVRHGLGGHAKPGPRWPLAFVRHVNGDEDLLVRPATAAGDQVGDGITLVVECVDQLPSDPATLKPNEARLWITTQGAWCALYQPASMHELRWPVRSIDELWLPGPGMNLLHRNKFSGLRLRVGGRLLGPDIRLTLPGERDLCCLGGFANGRELEVNALDQALAPATDWRSANAGALSRGSAMVAGMGMRLLEDLAAQRLTRSTWIRMTQTHSQPAPHIQAFTAAPDPYCPLCAISGTGSDYLHRLGDIAAAAVVRAKRRGEMKSGSVTKPRT